MFTLFKSLNEAVNRFAPNAEPVVIPKGKIIYSNSQTGISVVDDKNANYFRIEDTTEPCGRNYLDVNENDMNNVIINGKHRGEVNLIINELHILTLWISKELYGKREIYSSSQG